MTCALDAIKAVLPTCCLACALAAAPALAQPHGERPEQPAPQADDASARQQAASLTAQAHSHYRQRRYLQAASLYRRAYQTVPAPELLFNRAQCQRQLGQIAHAIELYQAYLNARPEAPQRSQIEHWIATQRSQLDLQRPVLAATPVDPAAVGATSVSGGTGSSRAAPEKALTDSEPASDEAIYERWWFWAGVGVVTASVLTLVALGHDDSADFTPGTLGTVQWE
jgi:tetratricopeptide (TPR) repeat protein